jgi:alpha-mannosidase
MMSEAMTKKAASEACGHDELSDFSCVSPKLMVHLICNAHLDPVWQWRWDEGASEALATFRNAVDILDEHPALIFCHNEAVLYQWAERLDPALFDDIRRLVKAGRWAISGGWFIQPDVNLPGTESLIRTIAEGRRYFRDRFEAAPRVAYNFDSFGHSGGLPQILRQAGYEMYVHMRPQAGELALPADLYRWRGVDGTTIPAYRIAVGLYHTEHDNIEDRLRAGVELALKLGRDVPVFWGLGNHGGGATRRDLRTIDAFIAGESRVRIVHSTPDRFFEAVKDAAAAAPVHEGDLQRSFTGCYTSLSRLKRQAVAGLGRLAQAESAAAAASWLSGASFPEPELRDAWTRHVFNDFHDILTGTCVEPAERDALGQYGRAEDIARSASLAAAASLNRGSRNSPPLPVTVFNANPSLRRVPVEFECMADHRPFWKGTWRMRLFRADGREVPCQEEQPESLLPFNNWRRRLSFVDDLPGLGVARYYLKAFEIATNEPAKGPASPPRVRVPKSRAVPIGLDSPLGSGLDPKSGLVTSLVPEGLSRSVAGPLFEPLVVEDRADSWGTGQGSYRKVVGRFKPAGAPAVIEQGPVRTITRSALTSGQSRVVMDVVAYPSWPVLEFRFRVTWNEERRRLKLRVPVALDAPSLLVEIPGGAIERPADGQEHVHGRWLVIGDSSAAIGIASSGQHGLDFKGGELRLSVLRSSAYCHERGFNLGAPAGTPAQGTRPPSPAAWKFADIGVHEFRLLVTAGARALVGPMMPGLADHLADPPAAYAHLPYDAKRTGPAESLLDLDKNSVRLLACKRSWDGNALIVRLQEAVGKRAVTDLRVAPAVDRAQSPSGPTTISLTFAPFEIKTVRIERDGRADIVRMIEEDRL